MFLDGMSLFQRRRENAAISRVTRSPQRLVKAHAWGLELNLGILGVRGSWRGRSKPATRAVTLLSSTCISRLLADLGFYAR